MALPLLRGAEKSPRPPRRVDGITTSTWSEVELLWSYDDLSLLPLIDIHSPCSDASTLLTVYRLEPKLRRRRVYPGSSIITLDKLSQACKK